MEEHQEMEVQEARETQEVQAPRQEAQEMQEEQAQDCRQAEGYSGFEEHIQSLESQAQVMQQTFPGFDLRQELCNPVFLQLTAPGTGISVEDAYYALHRQEIQRAAAQQAKEQVVSAIQSGARRPLEAGTTSQGPSVTSFRYGNASREQREAFKKELRRAWGRGETVYPNGR